MSRIFGDLIQVGYAAWAGLAPHQIVQQILRRWPSLVCVDSPKGTAIGPYSSPLGEADESILW